MNDMEREHNPEAPLPLDRLFTVRYHAVLTEAQLQINRLREQSTPAGSAYYNVPRTLFDEQPYAQHLLTLPGVHDEVDVVRLSTTVQIHGEVGQAFLVAYLREQPTPELSSADIEANSYILENAKERGFIDVESKALNPKAKHLLNLAEQTGIVLPKNGNTENAFNGDAERLATTDLESAMTLLMLMHESESIRGITKGWNQLVLPIERVQALLAPHVYKRLRNLGYLSTSKVIGRDGIHESVILNITPSKHRPPKVLKEHILAVDYQPGEHREGALKVVDECYGMGWQPTGAHLPDGIVLVSQAQLRATAKKYKMKDLHALGRYEFITPAWVQSEAGQRPIRKIYRSDIREGGDQLACYFVARSETTMRSWKKSKGYEQWMLGDQLTGEWRSRWQALLEESMLGKVSYLDKDYGDVYAVTRAQLDTIEQQIPLPRKEDDYLIQTQNDVWLYFKDPAACRRYKRFQERSYDQPQKASTAREAEFIAWRAEQLMTLPAWDTWEAVPELGDNVRLVRLPELRQVLESLFPLQTSSLKTRGYLIDAQPSKTGLRFGKLIVCPFGRSQSDAVKQSAWYQARLQAKR